MNEVEISVGKYPFSKKMCLVLRKGSHSRILARFDGEREMRMYLACNPRHDVSEVVLRRLEAIITQESVEEKR